ncbi:uncharacterized protein LOC119193463, partial [Manduca sexta]|uniref:uncharacterized protein LOC119193463 n=1 Tax=Manduca sexta TaxID=7130 RepID=UPI00188FEF03
MFPKDPNLRAAWVEALGMTDWEPKDRSTICSEHFRKDDFYVTKGGLRKIKDGAVPVVTYDSSEDLDAPAALRVCRICLAMEGQMYHIRDHKLDEIYENVTGIYLSEDDKLPQKLCWECAHRLLSTNGFRNKALRSQALLMNLLQPEI